MFRETLLAATMGLLLVTHQAGAAVPDPPSPDRSSDAKAPVPASPFEAGEDGSGWIPFEFFGKSRLFIPAEVNGVAVSVMLDSGASDTVIDTRFVNMLKVKASGHFTGQGAGGSAAYTGLHGVDIKLGAIRLRDTEAVGIDLAAVEHQVGHDLPVVLGGDVFAYTVVDIDFAHHRIAFRNPAAFTPPADAYAAPVTKAGENFAIQAQVEGRPAKLVFDIGNASALNLYDEFWNRPEFMGRPVGRPVSTMMGGGLGGMHVYKLATVKTVQLGGVAFADVPTVLEGTNKGVAADGNVGMPMLRRFRLMVDLPHGRVLFAPPADTGTVFDANHSGLTLAPDPAGARVLYVALDSPGYAAGLEAGDVIVTLDGATIKAWEASAGLQRWIYGAPGRQVRVGLLHGAERRLVFGRYF